MADTLTGRPVAAVRLEGTISEGADLTAAVPFPGAVRPGAREALDALRAKYHVVIVTALSYTNVGLRVAFDWIVQNRIPYDELWASYGVPAAERWFDDTAEKLQCPCEGK